MTHPHDVPLTMRRVYEHGLTTLSGGNISMRDADAIWITPSGIDKGSLQEHDVVRIDADGTVSGDYRPSSEYPFHQAIYAARDDVTVVIHAHSPALVAYCIAHQAPDTRIIKEAHEICGAIGYADYVMPGSPQLGEKLAEVFSEGYDVVIMENHGVVVVAESMQTAYQRLEMAALVARVSLYAKSLDTVKIPAKDATVLINEIENPPESESFRQRGIQRGLFPETGTYFYPVDDSHRISTRPPCLMVFAVTHTALDTRTIPEAYMTLHDVPLIDDDEQLIEATLQKHEAVIVKNSRVIVSGKTWLQVYDRLEVLEYTARSIIEANRLGGVVPMPEEATRALDETYHQYYKGLSG